ncbi:hypothetical protein FM076_32625 [Streptomyces albus subsp. chlorinus]|uniref:hypothetical protein n=1 Tax=Streptomyces albus TaxID=1888 RepID=UPI00156F5C15|nr:hypothetical protein [Streptomyces albus]NSC25641.1 hypothetical protein [Streptomyces albus subsp. chlorinus]
MNTSTPPPGRGISVLAAAATRISRYCGATGAAFFLVGLGLLPAAVFEGASLEECERDPSDSSTSCP